MSRKAILAIVVVASFLLGGLAAFAQRESMPTNPSAEEKPVIENDKERNVSRKRIREGTTFQGKKVVFQKVGTRTTIRTLDDTERYTCLENLNLERILSAIERRPARNIWAIDGMFTEFQGENYILIRRGVVSSGNAPPQDSKGTPDSKTMPVMPVKSAETPGNT